jgi:superkiller protein 3
VKKPPVEMPSRGQTVIAWGLLGCWLVLMCFGVVAAVNPPWLQRVSRGGIVVEARDYKNFGDDALRQGKYGLAVAQYRKALDIKPDLGSARINLAIAYIRAGDTARGARILREALPTETRGSLKGAICYNLGECREAEDKSEEAIGYYQRAVDCNIEQDKIYRKLGSLYLKLGRLPEARAAFEKTLAAQLDPSLPYQYMLHRSLDIFEGDPAHLAIIEEQLARGISTEDLRRYDLEIITQMQQRDPEIAKTHNHLGVICAQLKDLEKAHTHFQKSLEIWPGNPDATKNLLLLRRLGVGRD